LEIILQYFRTSRVRTKSYFRRYLEPDFPSKVFEKQDRKSFSGSEQQHLGYKHSKQDRIHSNGFLICNNI